MADRAALRKDWVLQDVSLQEFVIKLQTSEKVRLKFHSIVSLETATAHDSVLGKAMTVVGVRAGKGLWGLGILPINPHNAEAKSLNVFTFTLTLSMSNYLPMSGVTRM